MCVCIRRPAASVSTSQRSPLHRASLQILTVGSTKLPLSVKLSDASEGTSQLLYRLKPTSETSKNSQGEQTQYRSPALSTLSYLQPVSYRLTLNSTKSSANHDAAAQRLKKMREKEKERKKNSRAVMIEQDEFDKRGRLTTTARSGPSGGSSTPDNNRTSDTASRVGSSAMRSSKKGCSGSLVRARSNPTNELLEEQGLRGRSLSPAALAARGSSAVPPTSCVPSLRQKILFVLASGPKSRKRIVASVASPEPPILRLLGAVAHAPDELQNIKAGEGTSRKSTTLSPAKKYTGPVNRRSSVRSASLIAASLPESNPSKAVTSASSPGTIFVLKNEAYREVAAAIGAGHWRDDVPLSDKAKIWTLTRKALDQLAVPKDADEWAWIDLWKGSAEELQNQKELRQAAELASSPARDKAQGGKDEADGADTKGDRDLTSETDNSRPLVGSTTSAGKKKAALTTRDRLTRVVKGRGPKGEDLKKEQEKIRRKKERELGEAREGAAWAPDAERTSECNEKRGDTSLTCQVSSAGQAKAVFSSKTSGAQANLDIGAEKKRKRSNDSSDDNQSARKKGPQSIKAGARGDEKTSNGRSTSAAEPTISVKRVEPASRKGSDAQISSAIASRTRLASQAGANVAKAVNSKDLLPAKTPVKGKHHHGPSPSASLLVSEPWLDVRGPTEWRHLAERFARIWAQYELSASTLNREKRRLLRERDRAAKEACPPSADHSSESRTEVDDMYLRSTDNAKSRADHLRPVSRTGWRPGLMTEERRQRKDTSGSAEQSDLGDDADVRGRNGKASTPPMDFTELLRLVESQKAREGELRRIKTALVRWKRVAEAGSDQTG